MTSYSILVAIIQAALCFAIIVLIRVTVVYLGSRLGGILIGTPMLVFPLLAMQAWLGPPVTQDEMIGSIASIAAVTFGLWSMWLPINYSPLAALITMALSWSATLTIIYVFGVPDTVMAIAVIANAAFILIRYHDHQPSAAPARAKLTEAAIPTAIFLVIFFAAKHMVPEFFRGVLAMFPIVMLATLYFIRSTTSNEGFRNFVVYSHCAIVATAMFVVAVHFSLGRFPIALSLAIGLLVSLATSFLVSLVWRAPNMASAPADGGER